MIFAPQDVKTKRVSEALVRHTGLKPELIERLVRKARAERRSLFEVFVNDGIGDARTFLRAHGETINVPFVDLREKVIAPHVIGLLPREVAEKHHVIIFKKRGGEIDVAMRYPEDTQVVEFVAKRTGLKPVVHLTSREDVASAIRRYRSDLKVEFERIIAQSTQAALAAKESAEKMAEFVPIVSMVDAILHHAVDRKASDIHLETRHESLVVRFRVDGVLRTIVTLPRSLHPAIIARIRILANLKIDEQRLPQDGRLTIDQDDRSIAVRVSIIPSLFGSKAVLRILEGEAAKLSLPKLGLGKHDLTKVQAAVRKPFGMVLATGPTGSGKTTTLYALIGTMNREGVNISTIEDPIEFGIEGVTQTQVNLPAGLSFAAGLRALLRQDPNIIMVGEIRDSETATIAVDAALTGHLLLSTLHTNTAAGAIPRLLDMGVEPFLVASVLNAIVGQRLVRRVCEHCAIEDTPSRKTFDVAAARLDLPRALNELNRHGLLPEGTKPNAVTFRRGKGCRRCLDTGYRGRVGIYEVLAMSPELHDLILTRPSAERIERLALERDMTTMRLDGIRKAAAGLTTLDEIVRVTQT